MYCYEYTIGLCSAFLKAGDPNTASLDAVLACN